MDFHESSGLRYFYEPKSNRTIVEKKVWLTEPVQYTINTDALNERYDHSVIKDNATFRIVTLGDSFTFGLYVNTKDNWTELLEKELNKHTCKDVEKFEVINLGVPGYDVEYSIERFRLRGKRYNPDLVLWFLNDSDVTNRTERKEEHKFKYLSLANSEPLQRGLSRWANEQYWKEVSEDRRISFSTGLFDRFHGLYTGPVVAFSLINDDILKNKVLNKVTATYSNISYYHDFVTEYKSHKTPGYSLYPNDIHPSKRGHQEIMRLLFEKLKSNKVVPCL